MFPEKQKRGFRVHREKENQILDALLKGRALPGLHASQTPKGVQILGGGGTPYLPPWTIQARRDPDDDTDPAWQVGIKIGVTQGYVPFGSFSSIISVDYAASSVETVTAYTKEFAWVEAEDQDGLNYAYLKVTWVGGGVTIQTDDPPAIEINRWIWDPQGIASVGVVWDVTTHDAIYDTPSGSTQTEWIYLGRVNFGGDDVSIQEVGWEGPIHLYTPVIYSNDPIGSPPNLNSV